MKFWLDQNPGSIEYSWSSDWIKTLDLLDIHEVLIGCFSSMSTIKGNNKITELQAILQRESQNS